MKPKRLSINEAKTQISNLKAALIVYKKRFHDERETSKKKQDMQNIQSRELLLMSNDLEVMTNNKKHYEKMHSYAKEELSKTLLQMEQKDFEFNILNHELQKYEKEGIYSLTKRLGSKIKDAILDLNNSLKEKCLASMLYIIDNIFNLTKNK